MHTKDNFNDTSDFAVTMLADLSVPNKLTLQLTWFVPEIATFLEKEMFFLASNGLRIAHQLDFKYTSSGHNSSLPGYLFGFGSNMHPECYNETSILLSSEVEKLHLYTQICVAINELISLAMPTMNGPLSYPWIEWRL